MRQERERGVVERVRRGEVVKGIVWLRINRIDRERGFLT